MFSHLDIDIKANKKELHTGYLIIVVMFPNYISKLQLQVKFALGRQLPGSIITKLGLLYMEIIAVLVYSWAIKGCAVSSSY